MIGTRLGPWILDRELGRGGMGAVYLAHRASPEPGAPDVAAVKVLAAHLTADPGLLGRFHREVDVLGKLDHAHIVRLLGAGAQDGVHYYAMEYVEGPSYQALLHQRGPLPWPEVVDMALQVCLALKHAHDHGVIHRDLKPSNLLRGLPGPDGDVGRFGTVKLTDFGIAWVFAAEHLTSTGNVVGTAEYLSPEQAAGKQPTKRSDLYSLGAVLYTLLCGRTPFQGEPIDLLHKHRYGQFDRPARVVPDLPADLDALVCELLEKDPERRPPDAAVLHKRLDSLRRKYERRANQNTAASSGNEVTAADGRAERPGRTGPATLMAKLMREELESQNRGGPVKRFFNHPVVLVVLFVLTLGAIVYTFWPDRPEKLFDRATTLSRSEDADELEQAEKDLERLRNRHPDFRDDEVDTLWKEVQEKLEGARLQRQEVRSARFGGSMSEAHWFYEKGLRLRQQGRDREAKEVWRHLVEAFGDVEAEKPWVDRARTELDEPSGRERKGEKRWASVRRALRHARELEKEGKAAEAARIRKALEALYAGDPSAEEILEDK